MTTFTNFITHTFHVVSCYSCGNPFGITESLYRRAVTDATGCVYCPACSKGTIWRESEAEKRIKDLEKKLAWEAAEVTRQKEAREREKIAKEAAEASLRSTKGVVTKLKTRANHGVCPCCNRTFKQLASHMAIKHPNFNPPSQTPDGPGHTISHASP